MEIQHTKKIKITCKRKRSDDFKKLNQLIATIACGTLDDVKHILKNKEILNLLNNSNVKGLTPLMYAVEVGDVDIAEELIKAATAYTVDMNKKDGTFFSKEAAIQEEIADFSDEETEKLLNKLSAEFAELEVAVDVTMYVIPELYSALVDSRLATTGKNSSVSIDENGLYWFKGFRIEQTPKKYFAEGDVAYLVPDGVAIPFIGISLVRAMEDSKYAGTILQTLSKGGRFVLDDNKKAIAKVALTVGG